MSSFSESISPELVLVSPELAAIARADLPDRPWEAFLPAVDPAIGPAGDPADADVLRLRPPEIVRIPDPPVERVVDAVVVASHRPSQRRSRVPVGLILLVAFLALVTAGSLLPVRDAPTLGPLPARANGLSTVPVAPATPQVPAVQPASRPSTTRIVHPVARPQVRYILARGLGILRVDAGARSIAELRMNVGCRWEVVIHRIRLASDGRFSTRQIGPGQDRPTVTVAGVFLRAGTVRGTISVTKGRCVSGPVRFTGRLS